jgi:plastocyanin
VASVKGYGRLWAALAALTCVLLLGACGSGGSGQPAASGSSTSPMASGSSMSPMASGSSMAGGSGAPAVSSTAGTIVIKNFMFAPMSVTVAPGATVTVRNEDTVTHTLTAKSDPKLFSTGNIAAGQSVTFKAPNTAGSYSYICSIHQYMTGTIVVR